MKWTSKYSFQILNEAKKYLELTLTDPRMYLSLNKIIIENVLPYIDTLKIKESDYPIITEINELAQKHEKLDKTGTIRSVLFYYRIKIAENTLSPLEFLNLAFSELEKVKIDYFGSYDKCLEKFK